MKDMIIMRKKRNKVMTMMMMMVVKRKRKEAEEEEEEEEEEEDDDDAAEYSPRYKLSRTLTCHYFSTSCCQVSVSRTLLTVPCNRPRSLS